jgi:2-polyprenyl-6-methoxyphenol hydroxylase-like FAD-dependent oxidoreductase
MADRRLDELHEFLRRRARAGKWLPAIGRIAEMLGIRESHEVTELLWRGEQAGRWQVLRDGGFRVTGVVAADGSWRVVRDSLMPSRPHRRCLACRKPFVPEHRYNFLCCAAREAA